MDIEIDSAVLSKALNRTIELSTTARALGYVDSSQPKTLTFLDDARYVDALAANANISIAIVTSELATKLTGHPAKLLKSKDPRHDFYSLYNYLCRRDYRKFPTKIHPTAQVHPRSYVSDFNVTIGAETQIHPMACVMPDVEIGDRCTVYSGAVVGLEGYEKKRTHAGVLSVLHTGRVILRDDVEVGGNACVAKGMYLFGDTVIGEGTRINGLAFVGHGVHIGKECFLHLGASVSGASVVGDEVWIGPKATVSNGLKVGNGARISLGAVVTRDVRPGQHVTGNFAIDHQKFIDNMKKQSGLA